MPVAGVPESVAVPSPLSTKVTPAGNDPVSLSGVGIGKPVVVTVNVPNVPVVNVVLSALVIAGAWSTVSVKLWLASGTTPLAAVIVSAVGTAGARRGSAGERGRTVENPHEVHARGQHAGLAQGRDREPGGRHGERARAPAANVVLPALVIAGAWSTVSVKLWMASGTTPLAAVIESA